MATASLPAKSKKDKGEVVVTIDPAAKAARQSGPKLDRTTFRTSREMDFFSEKELTTQTGHAKGEWAYVFLKETFDNALDACEEADIPPVIHVSADAYGITVKDNGAGIPADTLEGALDFTVRASNREQYVAPDRGAQGNALMTLLSMPYVVDPEHGRLIITAHGVCHEIACRADPISQRAIVDDIKSNVRAESGTSVRIEWAAENGGDMSCWPFYDDDIFSQIERSSWWGPSPEDLFLSLIRGYAFFNPHLTLTLDWFGENTRFKATDEQWRKWRPNQPTSPHWYECRHLERLIAAYITHDRDNDRNRTVADFVKEFDGLSGNTKRKAVLEETSLARVHLSGLVKGGELDHGAIARLLTSMKAHTKEVKTNRLGIIGKDHFAQRLEGMGGDPEQYEYKKVDRVDDGIPFVLETAFSWLGDEAENRRHIFAGANWSPGINNPFRSFGQTGEGLEAMLTEMRAGACEPIVFLIHLAHPRVEYTDRGKSAIVIGGKS